MIAVTLGDPAGIGPEVTEGALRELGHKDVVLVGPDNIVEPMASRLGVRCASVEAFNGKPGEASAEGGRVSLAALMHAIELGRSRKVRAIVTAPINKTALALAGSPDRGHTEILARELGQGPTAMAFFSDKLRVVLATTHVPLKQAIDSLSTERVVEVTALLDKAMRTWLGKKSPHLALAGLNPHAGEGGLLGDDEIRVLEPAVRQAQARGIAITGPYPADTLFSRAFQGDFDGVVALYHDQGLIPMKLLSFGDAVNVTLGLSCIRTSPDHGTAYDLVGTGEARHDGMRSAIAMAFNLARRA